MATELICGVSDEAYHADRHHTSHSRIRDYANHGAAFYYERYLTGEIARKVTGPLEYGTAFEALLQRGGDAFAEAVMVEPENFDGRTTAGKQWRAAANASGKITISHDDYLSMLKMAERARTSPHLPLIESCGDQPTLRGHAYGLQIQARPDWLNLGGHERTGFRPYSVDLKTTKDLSDLSTREGVVSLGYHTQSAITRALMRQYLAERGEDTETEHYLFVVEKCYPHRNALLRLNHEVLDYGDLYLEKYGRELARCIAEDHWPVALPDVIEIGLPRRAQQRGAAHNDNAQIA